MSKDPQNTTDRRTLLTSLGVAAVAGMAASAPTQAAQTRREEGFQPARHAKDSWMGELAGSHRAFIDSSTLPGGANAVRYAYNILFTHGEEYAGSDEDYALILCFRHAATPYGYNDAMWAKYGKVFSRGAAEAPTTNPMNTASLSNGMNTLSDLEARGVQFAVCNKATQTISRRIAAATGEAAEAIYEELISNAIPQSRFVPAGVIAVTRAQEYRYSLLYAE